MSGHQRYSRKRSSESSSPGASKRASTTDTDDDVTGGSHRRLERSSASLPVHRSPASHQSWVLLNRDSARRADFPGDSRTSAMSRTSRGEQISVSFVLVQPPDTSFLTADLPPAASTTPPTIVAAHGDVVLFAITSRYDDTYPADVVVDLFVYQASRLPSLLLLPSTDGPEIHWYSIDTETAGFGIMSCTSNDDDDDSPPFVIAYLEITPSASNVTINAHLFSSGSGQWEVFKNMQVQDPNGDRDELCYGDQLSYWLTDEVVQYGRRYMIWVDYYRGMVIMDLSSQLEMTATTNTRPPPPPSLRYVQLPVDRVGSPAEYDEFGRRDRGCPKESRSLCVTRYAIKFVSVDRQYLSNFGIGNRHERLTWNQTFRITTWSLLEDHYTWSNDTRIHEENFWDAFDGADCRAGFPHVEPQFPVVDADNPDVVVFQLKEEPVDYRPKWMIEVDLRKKVLLAATDYSKKASDFAEDINLVEMKSGFNPIHSELPRYLDAGQACKKWWQ